VITVGSVLGQTSRRTCNSTTTLRPATLQVCSCEHAAARWRGVLHLVDDLRTDPGTAQRQDHERRGSDDHRIDAVTERDTPSEITFIYASAGI
jgi:hypothetical protein